MKTQPVKTTGTSIITTITEPGQRQVGNVRLIFAVCFISTMFAGIVSMLMSVYLPDTVKDLLGVVSERQMNDVSAYINAVFLYGWMIGGIVWGVICDKVGRAKSVAFSTGCYGLFALLTIASSSWAMVGLSRFFSGFGIGGVLVTTTVLVSEIYTGKRRTVMLGVVSVGVPIGFFAAGVINNLVAGWRDAFYVGVVPVALSLLSIFLLPESTRWRTERNTAGGTSRLSAELFATAHRKDLVLGSVIFGAMLIGLWAIFSWTPTWIQSVGGLSDIQQARGVAMMILAGAGLVGSFFSGWIANRIGLRRTMLMCFAMCFIMTFIVFRLTVTVTVATFIELGILAFFFGISQGVLSVYIPNLFPTAICASATGFCFNTGRLFTATVVFFIGALVTLLAGYGNSIFTFSFVFIAGFIATLFEKDKRINQGS